MLFHNAVPDKVLGKVIWITGAGSGIGRALARQAHRAGAQVIGSDLRQGLPLSGVESLPLDVRDEQAFCAAAESIRKRYGRIDVLVNNAGVGIGGETQDIKTEDWKRILDVNVLGVVHGIQAVYPAMIARGTGHIVNVASVAGIVPLPGEIPYVASKFAVLGLSQTLRIEAKALGVRVTTICPGKIETPIYDTSPIVGYDKDKVLSLWPKGISADECAEQILRAIESNRDLVVITRFGKLLSFGQRLSPALMQQILGQYMVKMRALKETRPASKSSSRSANHTEVGHAAQ